MILALLQPCPPPAMLRGLRVVTQMLRWLLARCPCPKVLRTLHAALGLSLRHRDALDLGFRPRRALGPNHRCFCDEPLDLERCRNHGALGLSGRNHGARVTARARILCAPVAFVGVLHVVLVVRRYVPQIGFLILRVRRDERAARFL